MLYLKNIIFDLGGVILKGHPVSILDKLDMDKEEYDKYIPGIETEDIVEKTRNVYAETFEKGEVISFSQILEKGISDDIKNVYRKVSESKSEELVYLLNWFGSVKDYLKYIILKMKNL